MIPIKLLITLTIYLGIFFLGYILGYKQIFIKDSDGFDKLKKYTINFKKEVIDKKYTMKSSIIIKEIVGFCDSVGIKILSLDVDDFHICTLEVECTKNQHFLLIQELSKQDYHLEINNLTF